MLFNGTVHSSNKFSNLLLNLCPRMCMHILGHKLHTCPTMCPCFSIEPFTLDTSSATSCDTFSFNQSENGIPNDVIFCLLLLLGCRLKPWDSTTQWTPFVTSLYILNIDEVAGARRLVATHAASVKGLGHKFSNKFGNMWPVWKHH